MSKISSLFGLVLTGLTRLTVANEMLSLVGSIQHDPFSPEHVAVASKPVPKKTAPAIENVESDGEDDEDSEEEDGEDSEVEQKQRKRKGK